MFCFREEAEKYMTEVETAERMNEDNGKKSPSKKRRVRSIPITSKIQLYDKLMAEKEERSVTLCFRFYRRCITLSFNFPDLMSSDLISNSESLIINLSNIYLILLYFYNNFNIFIIKYFIFLILILLF